MGIARGTTATGRPTRGATVSLVLCLAALAAGCTGSTSGSADRSSPQTSPPSSIPVLAEQPHAVGPFPVRLRVGLSVLTPGVCDPTDLRLVCSVDGSHSWAPVEQATAATVSDVRTRLAQRHTSWTTVVAFAAGDAGSLARQSRRATAVGGVVLVVGADGRVLAALPPSTIHGDHATLRELDKAAAWAVVEGFSRG